MQNLVPTRRAGIDTGWKCNVECKFCYHIFKDTDRSPEPFEKVKADIIAAKNRGNDTIDLLGPGEPSIVPNIAEIISFAKSIDMRVCMITHAIIGSRKLQEILDAGIDDFLISMHGMAETHDEILGKIKGARKAQEKTIRALYERDKTYRVNFVMNSQNYKEIVEFSEYLTDLVLLPRIVNFINFNPHGEWSGNVKSKDFVADLRDAEPLIDNAIDILESAGIGVNVRYFPMCRISEKHRKNVCNDLQVMFDPYEWDYNVMPKTVDQYTSHGYYISLNIEEKAGECSKCDIHGICGGINRQYNIMTGETLVDAVKDLNLSGSSDFFYYRKDNDRVFVW